MLTDFLMIGGQEVANAARLRAYLENIGSPLDSGPDICGCDALTAEVLGEEGPYTTPEDPITPAPWYDPDTPVSEEFAGLLVLNIEGVDDHPVQRSVTTAVTGGGALGPARVQPREITVTALVIGWSCCGSAYGLRWLAQALQGCSGSQCGGDCLTLYDCCPDEWMTADDYATAHRMTFRRVALTDGPRVTGRAGDGGCKRGGCGAGELVTVEFTLTAATPWAYTDTTTLFDVAVPTDEDGQCIDWCVHDPLLPDWIPQCTGCRLAACTDSSNGCGDPSCSAPAPPVPTAPETCFCQALAANSAYYEVDLSDRPAWTDDVPMIEVYAGSEELRRLTITLYERTAADEGIPCEELADIKRCDPFAVWNVDYLTAGSVLTLDGQTGRATLDCGGECTTATSVFGRDGAPPTWPLISCAGFCLELASDPFVPPADDATVSFGVSGRVG